MTEPRGATTSPRPFPTAAEVHDIREELLALFPHWTVVTHGFFEHRQMAMAATQPSWLIWRALHSGERASSASLCRDRALQPCFVRGLCTSLALSGTFGPNVHSLAELGRLRLHVSLSAESSLTAVNSGSCCLFMYCMAKLA